MCKASGEKVRWRQNRGRERGVWCCQGWKSEGIVLGPERRSNKKKEEKKNQGYHTFFENQSDCSRRYLQEYNGQQLAGYLLNSPVLHLKLD